MKYEEGRELIQTGDIVFVKKKKTLISKLIAWVTGGDLTHVGIACWMYNDKIKTKRLFILEAQRFTRRRILTLSYYKDRGLVVLTPLVPFEQSYDNILQGIGKSKYSWLSVLYVGLRELLNGKLKSKDFSGEICSELVARSQNLDDVAVSPQKLHDILIEKGSKVRVVIND
jgi:hypothetical protein